MYFGTYSQIVLYARYSPLYNVLVVFGNLAICAPFYLFTSFCDTIPQGMNMFADIIYTKSAQLWEGGESANEETSNQYFNTKLSTTEAF